MNLDNWLTAARAHWKEFQPKRYASLQEAGMLDQALQYAVDQTHLEVSQLERGGLSPDEAFQMVREEYLFPPAER
jgi:hypothetical protein